MKTQKKSIIGFTLLELSVSIGIVALLAGIVTPFVLQNKKDAQITQALQSIDSLKQACQRYYMDLGKFPNENVIMDGFGTGSDQVIYELFHDDSPKWKGPYIDRPLKKIMGSYTARITTNLEEDLPYLFTVLGESITGSGCALILENVPTELAMELDKRLDPEYTSSGSHWKSVGTVIFGNPVSGMDGPVPPPQSGGSTGSGSSSTPMGGTDRGSSGGSSPSGGGSGSGGTPSIEDYGTTNGITGQFAILLVYKK